jgi:hypothetical protein
MMWAALLDPIQLQVFAAMATATGPGRQEMFPPTPNVRSVAYLTPTGAANRTGISVEDAYVAFRALEKVGLAVPFATNPKRNGWRLNTDNLAAAAGEGPPVEAPCEGDGRPSNQSSVAQPGNSPCGPSPQVPE